MPFQDSSHLAAWGQPTFRTEPRFLIDKHCVERYRAVDTFRLFKSFIQEDGDYYYASLATAFRHILNDSSLVMSGEKVLRKFRQAMLNAPAEIEKLREQFKDDDRVRPKYEWLTKEFEARIPEVNPPCLSEDDD